jgi:hypothetical protein
MRIDQHYQNLRLGKHKPLCQEPIVSYVYAAHDVGEPTSKREDPRTTTRSVGVTADR